MSGQSREPSQPLMPPPEAAPSAGAGKLAEIAVSGSMRLDDAVKATEPPGSIEYGEGTVELLGAKILIDWLRNRQQLLVPFKLDLQQLEEHQVDTLMQAMVAAAQAEGAANEEVPPRLKTALSSINASAAHEAAIDRAYINPLPMQQVLAQISDVRSGALIYAASVLAIDRRKLVNRHYLRYLATRLHLSRDLARSLEQRYAAS